MGRIDQSAAIVTGWRFLRAIGTDHADQSSWLTPILHDAAAAHDLELFHDGGTVRNLRHWKVAGTQLLATQTLPFEFECEGTNDDADVEACRPWSGSSAGKRSTVSDCELLTHTRFCASMTISNGDSEARDLDDSGHP